MHHEQGRRLLRTMRRRFAGEKRWLGLGIGCLVVVVTVIAFPKQPTPAPRKHQAESSFWAGIVYAVHVVQDDQDADPLARLQNDHPDPAMQSVVNYLQVHRVEHQSRWEKILGRVHQAIYGR